MQDDIAGAPEEDMPEMPRKRLTHLEKQDLPDGYQARLRIHVDYPAGESMDVEIRARQWDYLWGCEWEAEVDYQGKLPPHEEMAPVKLHYRAMYGQMQGDKRLDRTELDVRTHSGQRNIKIQEGIPRSPLFRAHLTEEEYCQLLRLMLDGEEQNGDFHKPQEDDALYRVSWIVSSTLMGLISWGSLDSSREP